MYRGQQHFAVVPIQDILTFLQSVSFAFMELFVHIKHVFDNHRSSALSCDCHLRWNSKIQNLVMDATDLIKTKPTMPTISIKAYWGQRHHIWVQRNGSDFRKEKAIWCLQICRFLAIHPPKTEKTHLLMKTSGCEPEMGALCGAYGARERGSFTQRAPIFEVLPNTVQPLSV